MADSLIRETLEQRLGNGLRNAQETLHGLALDGFTSNVPIGGSVHQGPVESGLDLANLARLRATLEILVIPALNAALAGVPGPFDSSPDGAQDAATKSVPTAAVT